MRLRSARALRCCCGLEEKAEEELLSFGLDRGKEEDLVGIGMAEKDWSGGEKRGGDFWTWRDPEVGDSTAAVAGTNPLDFRVGLIG